MTDRSPEVVRLLPDVDSQRQELKITLAGEALKEVQLLQKELRDVQREVDVVLKGIALLKKARGRQVSLHDPETGDTEVIYLWHSQ
jgi:hypothetical protein